jgi:hypothetical protein
LDTFEEHTVYCKELFGFKNIQDFVSDVHFDIFKQAGVLVKKETPVNLLSGLLDKRSTLRSAYVIVYGWVRGKHACVNLIRVLPLVGLGVDAFIIGHLHQGKWSNMRKRVTINMFLYHLHLTLLSS